MHCDPRQLAILAQRRARVVAAGVLALLLLLGLSAGAQNPVTFSPDVTADLGTVSAAVVAHHRLALDDAAGSVALMAPGTLPPHADVTGYEPLASGESLFAFDVTVDLPGLPAGMPAEPRDVVRFDPLSGLFSLEFDGSLEGVLLGAAVDAVGVDEAGDLLLSFDITISLVPVGPVHDEDLVKFAAGAFSLEYDGSAHGIASGLDLDGVSKQLGSDVLLLSFDASGTAAGVDFDDEDALAFDTVLLTYAMHFDGSLSDPTGWPPADLVALPEPGGTTSLLFGVGLLALLGWCRGCGPTSAGV
jgi:hypothetical protein